ncbi:DNA-binding NarL/FixJ family response regulator [Pedobacter sp. CG_S7]|uniref:response regulator transcription factor n=1 Tax=Pedobacter sp. CG_S7 TaxID=3143930 RepID=UPI003399221B
MKSKGTLSHQNFDQRVAMIKLIADEIPAVVVIHSALDLKVIYMNKLGLDRLGIGVEELQELNIEQYRSKYFNLEESNDYVSKIVCLIKSNTSDSVGYFQQIRNQFNKEWILFASNTQVFCRNESGQPTHIITLASNIDPAHHITIKVSRLMEELSFFRENSPLFLKLTKREKEVLSCVALGMNSVEISCRLFISPATVDTHRRNLRSKLCLKNNYDTMKFAQAYNLV